jgi:hypothetical protein
MADPALRAHLSETHLRNGHPGPPHDTRCGSSGVPAPCEAKLLDALSPDWKLHHRIAYGPRGGSAYWVDLVLAAPAHIAVEIDGHSHRQTKWKAIDRRKEEFLLSRGFRVIRIPNENVEHALEGVVAFITAVVARPAADQTARPW